MLQRLFLIFILGLILNSCETSKKGKELPQFNLEDLSGNNWNNKNLDKKIYKQYPHLKLTALGVSTKSLKIVKEKVPEVTVKEFDFSCGSIQRSHVF